MSTSVHRCPWAKEKKNLTAQPRSQQQTRNKQSMDAHLLFEQDYVQVVPATGSDLPPDETEDITK